jgi:hypothetical protein
LRAVNEEAVDQVNAVIIRGAQLPVELRLQHSRIAVEAMLETQWKNRVAQLEGFAKQDSWLWGQSPKDDLDADRLLKWMKSPFPDRIERFFAMWGVPGVFSRVTRGANTKKRFWTKLDELVERRNGIAHGDATVQATFQDVASYLSVVHDFCCRADRVMARTVARTAGVALPW